MRLQFVEVEDGLWEWTDERGYRFSIIRQNDPHEYIAWITSGPIIAREELFGDALMAVSRWIATERNGTWG